MVDQSEAASLKRQRTTIKASCTRIRTYVDTITAITSSVIIQLEERKIKLEYYWSQYYDVQSRLESFDEAEGADRGGFEEAFYALSSRIRELVAPSPTSRASASSISSSNARDSDRGTHIRLPKLNLPTFTGKYDEWLPFYDTFNAAIHSNTSLSDTQRFQYLRASLTGDASAVISSLELSDANYDVAWSILKDRYDNKRVIIQSHVKAILDLPLMSKENSVDLRKISDGTSKHLHALQALKRPIAHWDDILISILTSKLDSLTIREWENSLTGNELPTLKQLVDFIAHRSQVLEATARASTALARKAESKSQPSAKRASSCAATVKPRCHFCQGDHAIYYCKKFVALPVSQRAVEIRSRKLCANCLRSSSHASNKCTSGQCKVCHAKHNTLLHMPAAADASTDKEATAKADAPSSILATHTSGSVSNEQVMLSTAVVYVCDNEGSDRACRALLDCGSQANFISRKLVQDLGLKTRPLNVSISGVNGTVATSHHVTQIKLQSRVSSYTAVIECIIVDQVTDKIPAVSTARDIFKFPRNIRLADPRFNISSDIDLLIGVELFWSLICVGQVKSSDDHPTLQKTRLGWILAGRLGAVTAAISKVHSFHASISNAELHEHVSRAWQMENISSGSDRYTMEEGICERHFMDNVSQNSQGRYTVKLPIKEHALGKIGDSRDAALKRLKRIERRFKRDPALKIQYAEFVKEYISLGHMRRLEPPITEEPASFYLPHHCVFKIVGQTSKIRVVFDASCRSTTGVSLNDVLLVGPNVQQDLISILLRFRYFLYVITADIIKMYRQISMHPSQTRLQRILWRDDPSMNVDTYELTTVTYGTASASFLATRCLKHLAEQHAFQFPRGSACVLRNFYVDEMLAGADAIDELKLIRDETNQLLKLGAFELSKWASNTPELLEADNRDCDPVEIKDKPTDSYILGMQWNHCYDTFQFSSIRTQT
ncbi:hypothetical protein ALC60_01980 [Trachymyrmex zeteki]|uniref:Uncharacterized protein n=1 Tax=Mycetomoellerius zeteki TaxID=64791 RepID=A0A151XF58_9HYME|nr:hypothetical protein ALC60_01980 [Trachymyrmex zeteki]